MVDDVGDPPGLVMLEDIDRAHPVVQRRSEGKVGSPRPPGKLREAPGVENHRFLIRI